MPLEAIVMSSVRAPRPPITSVFFARTVFTCMAAFVMVLSARAAAHESAGAGGTGVRTAASLQHLVDTFRALLAIEKPVIVSIVPTNPRMASMVPPNEARQPFQLVIEGRFLDVLSDDELAAVIAHELGHVWVATHHPYLQTEELANSIAMRVVTRDSLERVYAKVWARDGSDGDLARFLGTLSPASEGLAPNK